jgi:GTP-binding protein EngB required for normal cell division
MRHYMIVGRTGVGKSSFVNTFFAGNVAPVDHYESCTKLVDFHAHRGGPAGTQNICLIDTPGLMEGDGKNDQAYLKMMADRLQTTEVECFIYVTSLAETRFPTGDEAAIVKLTENLGPQIWSSSWLVFTFAASVSAETREKRVDIFRASFIDCVSRNIGRRNSAGRFRGFQQVLMVDNLTNNWAANTRPLAAFF